MFNFFARHARQRNKSGLNNARRRKAVPRLERLESRHVLASYLSSILAYDFDNTFEDQSREAYVDVNGDATFSVGDVLVGFVRIDDHLPPVDGIGEIDNQIFAVFSQEVTAVTPNGSNFIIEFGATTAAGLTLSDLTGIAAPAGGIVAVYSGAAPIINLITTSPGDQTGDSSVNLFDYFAEIQTNLDLTFVAGFGTGPTQADDYFTARTMGLAGGSLIAPGGAALVATIPSGVQVVNFTAGLSILLNNDAHVNYSESVISTNLTAHQLVVRNGAASGTFSVPPVPNVDEWGDVNPDVSYSNPGGFIDDADYLVHPTLVQAEARITIEPDATNEVGDPHIFTVTVEKDAGSGFVPAAGENVDFTLVDSNGAAFVVDIGLSTCDDAGANTDVNGQCTIVFTSATAGQVTGNASVTLDVNGQTLTRDTDPTTATVSGPGGSDSAVKVFVDAFITIAPDDTNEVGDSHTFTVTVWADNGDGIDNDGQMGTFDRVGAGEDVSVTLDGINGALPDVSAPSDLAAADPTVIAGLTNASGEFQVTFTSATAGQVIGTATSNVDVGGLVLPRTTDGTGNNSDAATKVFVDARITITPDAVNPVGAPHTFVVDVEINAGDGNGFVPAAVGNVDVTLADSGGAVSVIDAGLSTCDDNQPTDNNLDGSGQCTIVFTSFTPGTVVGNASVSVLVGGLTLVRDTDPATAAVGAGPGGSGPAVKDFVAGAIRGTKSIVVEEPALSGRMTGGGSVFTADGDTPGAGVRVTHGFEIHCSPNISPNNLEINWDGGNNFHLESVTAASCLETPVDQLPRAAPFDTYIGIGTGRFNNELGYVIQWTFVDAGEPGKDDTAKYYIFKDTNGNGTQDGGEATVLSVAPKNLTFGNQQAHPENKDGDGSTPGTPTTVPCSAAPDPTGCAGVTIHLIGVGGGAVGVHQHTTTDSDGDYEFINLPLGDYEICEEVPDGFVQTSPMSGADCTPHTPIAGGTMGPIGHEVTLTAGTLVVEDQDFSNMSEQPLLDGRMTGGGSVFTTAGDVPALAGTRVTHGFEIHCNPQINPQRIEVNWKDNGKENHFHLLSMTTVTCLDTAIIQAPPDAPIDTYIGVGTGRFTGTFAGKKYHNATGFTIQFTFTDGGPSKGEPGVFDTATYLITGFDANSNPITVLEVAPALLTFGNHQAHEEHKSAPDNTAVSIHNQIDQVFGKLDGGNQATTTIVNLTKELTYWQDEYEKALLGLRTSTTNGNGVGNSSLTAVPPDASSAASASELIVTATGMLDGEVLVSIQDPEGKMSAGQRDRIQDAIATLTESLAAYGVTLVQVADSESVDIQLRVASTSPCGGAADGVLGCATDTGEITIVEGWNWYTGASGAEIGANQYDYQAIVTHELGHGVWLGHSGDANSVMYPYLGTAESRRKLTLNDLALIGTVEGGTEALYAKPVMIDWNQFDPDPRRHWMRDDAIGSSSAFADDRLADNGRRFAGDGLELLPAVPSLPLVAFDQSDVLFKRIGAEDLGLLLSLDSPLEVTVEPSRDWGKPDDGLVPVKQLLKKKFTVTTEAEKADEAILSIVAGGDLASSNDDLTQMKREKLATSTSDDSPADQDTPPSVE